MNDFSIENAATCKHERLALGDADVGPIRGPGFHSVCLDCGSRDFFTYEPPVPGEPYYLGAPGFDQPLVRVDYDTPMIDGQAFRIASLATSRVGLRFDEARQLVENAGLSGLRAAEIEHGLRDREKVSREDFEAVLCLAIDPRKTAPR